MVTLSLQPWTLTISDVFIITILSLCECCINRISTILRFASLSLLFKCSFTNVFESYPNCCMCQIIYYSLLVLHCMDVQQMFTQYFTEYSFSVWWNFMKFRLTYFCFQQNAVYRKLFALPSNLWEGQIWILLVFFTLRLNSRCSPPLLPWAVS